MKQNSEDEQALIKIQHDWAKARIKGDSSYTRRLEAKIAQLCGLTAASSTNEKT
jgi:hypothetical protein